MHNYKLSMGGLGIVAPPSTVIYNLKVVSHTNMGGNHFLQTCGKNMPLVSLFLFYLNLNSLDHLGANLVKFSAPTALHST